MSEPISAEPSPLVVAASQTAPAARFLDTLTFLTEVILPTLAKGVIVRRPSVMAVAEHFDFDRRAVRRLQQIRSRYGTNPLRFRILGREVALILKPEDVHRVPWESPEPFLTATREKTAALAHFEPKNVLISKGTDRAERRRYNEEVLDTNRPMHRLGRSILEIVAAEGEQLRSSISADAILTWEGFAAAWFRIVRRVVFGSTAREDHELSRLMFKLRSRANWAFLRPKHRPMREALLQRIRNYLANPDPSSLTGMMAGIHAGARIAPEHQVPQWLFAFDPAGMATFRALALLGAHPDQARVIRAEVESQDDPTRMPKLRATILESLRLWPTTPLLLRETSTQTAWENGTLPAHTAITIFTPFSHRDDERLPYANQFTTDLWSDDKPTTDEPLIPFSEGPAACPGRDLVLLVASAVLADLLRHARVRLRPGSSLRLGQPLPGTLNHFALSFDIRG